MLESYPQKTKHRKDRRCQLCRKHFGTYRIYVLSPRVEMVSPAQSRILVSCSRYGRSPSSHFTTLRLSRCKPKQGPMPMKIMFICFCNWIFCLPSYIQVVALYWSCRTWNISIRTNPIFPFKTFWGQLFNIIWGYKYSKYSGAKFSTYFGVTNIQNIQEPNFQHNLGSQIFKIFWGQISTYFGVTNILRPKR